MGAINKAVMALFERITDSSEVHIAMFNWTITEVADRLIEQLKAHPGAKGRIIMDPRNFNAAHPKHRARLNDKLRAFAVESGQLTLENDQHPTAGLLNTAEPSKRRRMHNKFFLFRNLAPTSADDGAYTIALSSANLTYAEVGESNEMVTVAGDQGLYQRFLDYWTAMAQSAPEYRYKQTHTYSHMHDHLGMFFPSVVQQDRVLEQLEAFEEGLGKARNPARVRIAMSIWHRCRKAIAAKLVELYQEHDVDVKIILKEDLDIALEVYSILQKLPAGSVRFLPVRHPKLHYGLHSKLMLIDGPFPFSQGGEAARQRLTFTGSHNWNHDAHRYNSETWLRIADKGVYETLEAHWNELWGKSVDSTAMYEGVVYDSTGCWETTN
ncbi:MAG: phospholipase D-like domain-containing protein [Bacteroidota bacterium]